MIKSHSVCPVQSAFPYTLERKSCLDISLATEQETIFAEALFPFKTTLKLVSAIYASWGIIFHYAKY
jgi:hypothetical protein